MPRITVAHSPDSDDAFMHYALAENKIDSGDITFTHVLKDIETLNNAAAQGTYEVTAISIHAYAYLADKYALMGHGASMGEPGERGYGPRLVTHQKVSADRAKKLTIAHPGVRTSSYLALRLWAPDAPIIEMAFDEILPAVAAGEVAAGVLIHEGQLTYGASGVHLALDFGRWWGEQTDGLPLPLGGNAIRRDLDPALQMRVSKLLRQSIEYSLNHREEALEYAMQYARGLETDVARADEFVGMYVNARTLDYGDDGRKAVKLLLDRGYDAGLIPHRVDVKFVD